MRRLSWRAVGLSGPLWSYTRLTGETTWTCWPGEGFDAGYGLASPFSALRLYPLADERAPGEADSLQGVTESVTKAQAVFTADTVQRLLRAGAFAVATDPEERSALEAQLTPLFVPQTVTYWTGADGRVHQAAATLLTADPDGEPAPWLRSSGVSGGIMIPRLLLLRLQHIPMPMNQRRRINQPLLLPPRSLWIHAPTCGCVSSLGPACWLTRSR